MFPKWPWHFLSGRPVRLSDWPPAAGGSRPCFASVFLFFSFFASITDALFEKLSKFPSRQRLRVSLSFPPTVCENVIRDTLGLGRPETDSCWGSRVTPGSADSGHIRRSAWGGGGGGAVGCDIVSFHLPAEPPCRWNNTASVSPNEA